VDADLVVGVAAQEQVLPMIQRYEINASDARGPLGNFTWDGSSAVTPPFPSELPLHVRADSPVTVRVDGFAYAARGGADAPTPPNGMQSVVSKTVVVTPGCGPKRLLRMRLESSCASDVPGGTTCGTGLTCQAGKCVSNVVPAASLETYSPLWPQNEPDSCSKPNGGAPQMFLGTGQTDYIPLAAGAEVRAEAGPQGGHHIWIAVRMTQLNQNGTTITLTGTQPDTGMKAPRTSVVFSFEPDEGGFCKVYGIRFQLDAEGQSIDAFRGKPLDVTAELRDRTGRTATMTTRIRIANDVVQP
jgi:hypothetical protein